MLTAPVVFRSVYAPKEKTRERSPFPGEFRTFRKKLRRFYKQLTPRREAGGNHPANWHHDKARDAGNCANISPLMDLAFGTCRCPDHEPAAIGISEPITKSYRGQLLHPFWRRRRRSVAGLIDTAQGGEGEGKPATDGAFGEAELGGEFHAGVAFQKMPADECGGGGIA